MNWYDLEKEATNYLLESGVDSAQLVVKHWLTDSFGSQREAFPELFPMQYLRAAAVEVERLSIGEPLEYVTGVAYFYGKELAVNKHVLIPRPETEELVRWILEREDHDPVHFADLCTGSGCIAGLLAHKRPSWKGIAVDVDHMALEVAQINLIELEVQDRVKVEFHDVLREEVYLGDGECWDVMVSNPPYIPDRDWMRVDPNVASYEPHLALRVSDDDPLIFYKRIANTAKKHLKPGGRLYFECNDLYATDVCSLLQYKGFQQVDLFKDMQGKNRHVRAVKR